MIKMSLILHTLPAKVIVATFTTFEIILPTVPRPLPYMDTFLAANVRESRGKDVIART